MRVRIVVVIGNLSLYTDLVFLQLIAQARDVRSKDDYSDCMINIIGEKITKMEIWARIVKVKREEETHCY